MLLYAACELERYWVVGVVVGYSLGTCRGKYLGEHIITVSAKCCAWVGDLCEGEYSLVIEI